MILNAHPEMVSVGELTGPTAVSRRMPIPDYPCSCGEPLKSCPFWEEVVRRVAERGIDFGPHHWNLIFELGRGRYVNFALTRSFRSNLLDKLRDAMVANTPGLRGRLAELGIRNRAVIEAALELCSASAFVDASKDPTRARYLLEADGLDVRVVHLLRDAPAFVNSEQRRKRRTLQQSIRIWKRCAAHVERLRAVLPEDRFLRVRYEDLCKDLEGELRRITDLAGVSPFTLPVRFRNHDHHVIGNPARWSDEKRAVLGQRWRDEGRIVLDERWRTELSPEATTEIERRTETERRLYGYT
jgi:hypothetical protein